MRINLNPLGCDTLQISGFTLHCDMLMAYHKNYTPLLSIYKDFVQNMDYRGGDGALLRLSHKNL